MFPARNVDSSALFCASVMVGACHLLNGTETLLSKYASSLGLIFFVGNNKSNVVVFAIVIMGNLTAEFNEITLFT